jgi:hypothetical protein
VPEVDFESRKRREGLASAYVLQIGQAAQHRGISGYDDADVCEIAQSAWEGRRHGGKAAYLNEV